MAENAVEVVVRLDPASVDEAIAKIADVKALATEVLSLRAALYGLVTACMSADSREDLGDVDGTVIEAGMRALPQCSKCAGHGSADGLPHEDEEREPCAACEGWGFLAAGEDA